ncbi:hypothetical protein MMC12_006864 [Toensbergia leucococca]|nr:hypothetical protein [Toensbergia leucococca]
MPFIPHTPETLLPRSDSKNPATTCKAITSTGRPCRRSLAVSPNSSPKFVSSAKEGVLAVLLAENDAPESAAAFFCWQHKDQAASLIGEAAEGRRTAVVQLKERTSIDTLAERIGLLDVRESGEGPKGANPKERSRPVRRDKLPRKWQDVPGPLLVVPEGRSSAYERPTGVPKKQQRGESNLLLSLFCCVRAAEPEYMPPARVHTHTKHANTPSEMARISHSPHRQPRPSTLNPPNPQTPPITKHPSTPFTRPPSQTQALLSLIPSNLSPHTTSLLLSELSKPLSPTSDPGYIYIFHLTPTTNTPQSTQPSPTTHLSTPPKTPHQNIRTSFLLQNPNNATPSSSPRTTNRDRQVSSDNNTTILLKIGRASNVQRRLNEWSRQCNHDLHLLRYYPYIPTSSSPIPSPSPFLSPSFPHTPILPTTSSSSPSSPLPRKVSHVSRVERLIHIELAEMRVKRDCEQCGREHREWFEVAGDRNGVGAVDAVVRRWVAWGERAGT